MAGTFSGVLLVDKPAGLTSADVVSRLRRILRERRIGHAGTLDPMATGLLVVCVGEATKLAGYLTAEDKAYQGELFLGVTTDTLDAEGKPTGGDAVRASQIEEAELTHVMQGMVGPLQQIPPQYSAISVNGKRMHEMARAGKTVELAPRAITIHEFLLTGFAPPRASFSVSCSKGTYVRSLVRDIGEELRAGAHLCALRRTQSGAFFLRDAVTLDVVAAHVATGADLAGLGLAWRSPQAATAHFPTGVVPKERLRAVMDGKCLFLKDFFENVEDGSILRLVSPDGTLVAMVKAAGLELHYLRVFRLTSEDASVNLTSQTNQILEL